MKASILYVLILFYWNFELCATEWVNPFDMNVKSLQLPQECNCHNTPAALNNDLLRYRRSINLLLSSVIVDRTDPFNYKGKLLINIPIETYDFLKEFTKSSQEDPFTLHKVDHILTTIFTKPTIEQLTDAIFSWSDYIYFTFFNRTTGILLSILFVIFFCYKLLSANWTLLLIIKYLIFLACIMDFAFTWIHLLQENEINKIADTLRYGNTPPECDPRKMTFVQYFFSVFSTEDECKRYHKTVLKDMFWAVGPFTVFAHQFGQVILTPASYIGSAIANLTREMLGGLFWPLNVLLLPILFLFLLILICIILSFLTKTTFKVNLFHLLQFSFGDEERRVMGDVLSGDNLMQLLGVLHRPMVEDIKDTRPAKKHSKQSRNIKQNKALKNVVPEFRNDDEKKTTSNKNKLEVVKNKAEKENDNVKKTNNESPGDLTVSFCATLRNESFNKSSSET